MRSFATELMKPLVDHRLSRASAKKDVATYVRATLGASADRAAPGRLLDAIDEHVTRGLLAEELLAFYWRATALLVRATRMTSKGAPRDPPLSLSP